MKAVAGKEQCFFRPGLLLGLGGFGSGALWATSADLHRRFGEIPPNCQRLAIDFPSDPPRPPLMHFPKVPAATWNAVGFQPPELALIGYPQGLVLSLFQDVFADRRYSWLEEIMPFAEVKKCIGKHESGSIPALTRLFLALQVAAGSWDGEPNWLVKLETAMHQLSPQYCESAMLTAGVDMHSVCSTPAIVAIIGGASGGTNNGAMLPVALAVRNIAHRIGLAVEVHLHVAFGLYRPLDDLSEKKLALSATFSEDCEAAANHAERAWSFPVGPNTRLSHTGPLIDRAFRYEANEKMKGNYAAMLGDVSYTVLNYFFNRAFFETERNWTNA
jgi:hypothetical protein